jgi:hypothetical protein
MPWLLLTQLDALGQHYLTNMRRSLCCIQSLGTCRSTVHASILWLLMLANLLTGSANQHD